MYGVKAILPIINHINLILNESERLTKIALLLNKINRSRKKKDKSEVGLISKQTFTMDGFLEATIFYFECDSY